MPTTPIRDTSHRVRVVARIGIAVVAVIVLAMLAVAATSIRGARDAAFDHARSESRNLAIAFADEVAHNLDTVAGAMEMVAQRMRASSGRYDINAWAREIPLLQWATVQAAIVGPDGRLISTTLDPNAEAIDLSDREHVRVQLEGRSAGIFISKPVTGRVSHQVTIQVSRRVEGADQRLLGVIVFSLAPGQLTALHRAIDIGQRGVISLAGLDNVVRASFTRDHPDGIDGLDQPLTGGPRPLSIGDDGEGFYVRESLIDHATRLFSYHRVVGYPMVVTVGLDLDAALAAAGQEDKIIGAVTGVATLLLAGLAAFLIREIDRRAKDEIALDAERKKLETVNNQLTRDIELRQEVEQRLRTAQATLRDAVDSISEAFVIYDKDNRMVLCNEAYHRLYPESADIMRPGIRFEDVLRDGLAKKLYADAIGCEQAWLAERLQKHRSPSGFIEAPLTDGRWVLICERRMGNGGTAGLRIDITEYKRIQQDLRRTQEHLERAQRIAGIGSIEVDIRNNRREWSTEACRIFGIDPASVLPTSEYLFSHIHPDDVEKVRRARAEMYATGIAAPVLEYRILRPDGTIRVVHRENELVLNDSGQPTRRVITFKDVTALRAIEQRQRDLEAQLLQSQKLEALGTLAGGIAHDLNNMLMPVLALSDMLARRTADGSDDRDDLETIVQAARRGRELVQQILAFSRHREAAKAPVDLAQVVRQSLHILRASLPATVQICEHVEAVPPVFADAGQLHQVFLNLVTNAAHAIGNRMGTITVDLLAVNSPQQSLSGAARSDPAVRLRVSDTGSGMDAKTVERIFEPFFTTKEVGEGTGLGLSVVHGIVTAHDGTIEVRSALGKGTVFTVTLPAAGAQAAPSEIIAA